MTVREWAEYWQKKYLPLAILAHAGVDLLPALYQRGVVSMLAVEVWLWFWAALLVIWARRLYIRL